MNARRVAVVCALASIATAAADAPPAYAPPAYESFVLDTGEATSHTVLHGRITGGDVDDFAVFRHRDQDRRMAVYAFERGQWRRTHVADVPDDVIFVDMMELGGTDRLLMFRRGHIDWLDPETWTRRPLVAASSIYNVPPLDVPDVEIARDLNDDGLDDIALPDFDGHTVWIQRPDGSLSDPMRLAAEHSARIGFRSSTYRASDIYQLDHDGDGRVDLAFWRPDGMTVFRGTDTGFDTEPVLVDLPFAVSTDDVTVSIGFGGDIDETRTMLYTVGDMNGDGVGDLVTNTLEIGGLFDQTSRYDFYFGKRRQGATVFEPEPDTSISSAGVQGVFERSDFDGDGAVDFGMISFKLGIGKLIAVLLRGSVSFNMDFYFMRNNDYPEEPDVRRRVKLNIDLGSGRVGGNWVSVGDLTGDGVKDLLVQVDASTCDVYPGSADERLFAEEPFRVDVRFSDQGNVRLADLNRDGRDDMYMAFRLEDGVSHRIGVALSTP